MGLVLKNTSVIKTRIAYRGYCFVHNPYFSTRNTNDKTISVDSVCKMLYCSMGLL